MLQDGHEFVAVDIVGERESFRIMNGSGAVPVFAEGAGGGLEALLLEVSEDQLCRVRLVGDVCLFVGAM
jgi:hypothetical protein